MGNFCKSALSVLVLFRTSYLILLFLPLHINILPDDVICNVATYGDNPTFALNLIGIMICDNRFKPT